MPPHVTEPKDIRGLYRSLKGAGLTAQHERAGELLEHPDVVTRLYRAGTTGLGRGAMSEPFYPAGARKGLAERWPPARTEHFAERLWRPTTWKVGDGETGLDFHYVDREIVTARNGKAIAAIVDDERRLERLDLLLCNSTDRTPILAELKIRRDENAFYGLIQGLAHVAQLQSKSQRKRLSKVYTDYFPTTPEQLDLYVILFERPTKGKPKALLEQAQQLAPHLVKSIAVLRRVAFIEAEPEGSGIGMSECAQPKS